MEKVLLVEDNPGHALLLREMLGRTAPAQFAVTHVARLDEALERLGEGPFDLVLLDLSLPDSMGFETFAQAHARMPESPIIVLSGLEDEELALRAVREGAQDYLVKGQVDGNLLARAIRYAIERKRVEALVRVQRDLGLALGAATGLEQVLRLCVEAALRVSGMDYGGVYLVDGASGDMDLAYQQGLSPEFAQGLSRLEANSMPARMIMAGRPIYSSPQALNLPLDAPTRREGLRAMSIVPVQHEGQVVACLGVASRAQEPVPVFARDAMEAIAAQIGSVIARVRAESQRDATLEALQASNEQVVNILDSINDGFIALDDDLAITYFNKAAERLLGQGSAEVLGRTASEIFPETIGSIFAEKYAWAVREGSPVAFETYFGVAPHDDWFDVRIYPYKDGASIYFRTITERVRAQAEIRKFKTVADNANYGVSIADMAGDIMYVNPYLAEVHGYTPDELIGKNVTVFESSGRLAETSTRSDMQDRGSLSALEVWSKRKDGSTFPMLLNAAIIKGEEGEPLFMAATAIDISQRKQAESQRDVTLEALQESEQRYRTLFESASIGIGLSTLDGKILAGNEALLLMAGYTEAELLQTDVIATYQRPQDRALLLEYLQKDGFVRDFETVLKRKDGTTYHASLTVTQVTLGGEDVLLAMMQDVTARMQAQEQLRFQAKLLDSVREAVVATDIEGRIIYWGKGAEALYGYAAEQALGQHAMSIIESQEGEQGQMLQVFETGSWSGRRLQTHKDGSVFWTDTVVSLVTDQDGQPVGLIGIDRDVTRRVQADEQLKHYAAELERSNRELQQFAHVASHDLQEPLRMVTSYMQLLEQRYKGQLDADADDFIAFAVDGAERMQALIKGLLAYSRVGTRGKPFEPTDCQEILELTLDNLQVMLRESDASVTHDPLPTVMADVMQLLQLFQNLVSNAIKFRGERPPEIHVGAELKGGEWLFSVRDNGIGIEAGYFERIFLIFQRLHTQAEYPGAGIGLAICKRIIERHGGRMWVESEPGEGATFFFTMPERAQ